MQLLEKDNTGLIIIDVQEKLMPVMERKQSIIENLKKLLLLSELFNLPVIITEQYSKWLGPTLPEIIESLTFYKPIPKMHFDCCDVEAFIDQLNAKELKNIIVTGVESHICVFQTCASLLNRGYQVHVPQDAVGSRTDDNWGVGLELSNKAGAFITSTESVIYQILKKAGTPEFKQMLKVVK
jgi:nicotinamidase-related amidase